MAYDLFQTCLFVPGLNRAECASWVQAWGSVGAIVAAMLVANRATKTSQRLAIEQAQRAHDAVERSRVERHMEQIGPVLELFDTAKTELLELARRLTAMPGKQEWSLPKDEFERVAWIQVALSEVPVHSMPNGTAAKCLVEGRVLLGQAANELSDLASVASMAVQISLDRLARFNALLRQLVDRRDKLHQALNTLVAPEEARNVVS